MNRTTSAAELLSGCYGAAVAAAQPEPAMRAPLRELPSASRASWVIAAGKAAPGMARAIVTWLAECDREPEGGIVVSPADEILPNPALIAITGDHPIPRARSIAAGDALGHLIAGIPATATIHVALSGGASALLAAPLPGLSATDLTTAFELLLTSGLDIHQMNAVRKRLTRWSAGRLALDLAPRTMHLWLISDVPGDSPGDIASGPCTGDPWRSVDVINLLERAELLARLPATVQRALTLETPKPDLVTFRSIPPHVVASNATACAAAADHARRTGVHVELMAGTLRGEASDAAAAIAAVMHQPVTTPTIRIWGGETTVAVPIAAPPGGRSQELALAAARLLDGATAVLLAAGTDGRDGPTDAAGAMIDGATWRRIAASGRNPAHDLAGHDSYAALDAVGALLRTGASGTNVGDLLLGASGWD
jgi:hydroxypyruvate reductase